MKVSTIKTKKRLIIKNGVQYLILPVTGVAMFFIKERSVFIISNNSRNYQFCKTLSEIENQLDNKIFFRANRHTIVNINFIKAFTVCESNKLRIEMNIHIPEPYVITSQETAPLFKTWLCEC
jgi:DNA-binding LytR/AlgR family response regulator